MSVLGPELVTNGGFVSPFTDWVRTDPANWNFTGGTLNTGVATAGGEIVYQTIGITAGKSYQVQWVDATDADGRYTMTLGGTALAAYTHGTTNTQTVIAGSADSVLKFIAVSQGASIDNVSVKELSAADKIEKAIFDILRWDSTLSGLVSSRVYPHVIPQNTSLPAIAYSQIAGPRQHDLTATSTMVPSRWQFTIVAETYAELRALSDALRGALDNHSGVCGTLTIQCAHFTDETDLTDIVPGTDELRRYSKAIDFYINYNE